jgi:DNA helicase HerA-like ATPase
MSGVHYDKVQKGIFGGSGSGKSTLVAKMIKGQKRLIVFDTEDEYGPGRKHATTKVRVETVDEVRQAMRSDWNGFSISYVPPVGLESRALSSLCKLLMAAQEPARKKPGKPVLLVVEEMSKSYPVHGWEKRCPGFNHICARGRHFNIQTIGVSQRIAEVSTNFRGNCTEAIILKQQQPIDVDAAFLMLRYPRSQKAAGLDEVDNIQKLHYIHLQENGERVHGKLSFK